MPPRTNIFLIINLGCEMLYVIDQRLKAQSITLEKSAQVLRDLTCVLLDPKFLDQFTMSGGHPDRHLLTPQQCRILLSDIACCSLMRLDITSMDKLWDLMVMVFKWQITLASQNGDSQALLDLTFRHMDGIGRLIPEMKKTLLIDCTKQHLIEYWDAMHVIDRETIIKSLIKWVQPYSVKISILIRLGFQRADGTFEQNGESDFFKYYADHIGENIYSKHAYLATVKTAIDCDANKMEQQNRQKTHEIDTLISQLNINKKSPPQTDDTNQTNSGDSMKVNNILDEVSFNLEQYRTKVPAKNKSPIDEEPRMSEFVHVKTVSTLESILERFSFDGPHNSGGDDDLAVSTENKQFDATEELLRMLDQP